MFPEPRFESKINSLDEEAFQEGKKAEDSSKVYKIVYTMNLLPAFGKHFEFDDVNGVWKLHKDDVPIV